MPAVPLSCPHCGRSLEVPEELLGRKVRCRECQEVFATDRPTTEPKRRPRGESEPCPYCREEVGLEERLCPHCGKDLETEYEVDDRPWEHPGEVRRDVEPHRGGLVLTLGIISLVGAVPAACCVLFGVFGLGLGLPAWIMGQRDLRRMRRSEIDPEGRSPTQAGMICGIIGVAVAILGLLIQAVWILFSLR